VGGVPLGLVVALGVGLVLLALGIAWLGVVAIDERDEARAQIPRHRDALAQAGTAALARDLERALADADAEIEAALRDPLLPTGDLLRVVDGRVLLPRRAPPLPPSPLPSEAPRPMPDPEEETRRALVLAIGDGPEALGAWVDHRARQRLALSFELTSTLEAIEQLERADRLDPPLARALLRDGITARDGRVAGWLVMFLGELARVAPADRQAWLARAVDLGRRHLVRVDDAIARVAEQTTTPEPPHLDDAARATLACEDDACWVYRASAVEGVRGRRFEIHAWRDALVRAWSDSGQAPRDARVAIADGRVLVTSATWDETLARADERLVTKMVALAIVGALGLAVVTLAVVLQRRRAAYLDLRAHLLRAVTHELKTPIASISALAQTLDLRLRDVVAARDYPARIVATTDRLAFLVDNVLSYARLEQEAWSPRCEPIALAELGAWLTGDPVARAVRPVDLQIDVPADATLVADPDLVRLLVSNLVDNAAKYTSADRARVRFSARVDADVVRIRVEDDGPGLGVADPRHLFEAFARGHVQGVRGTGLGLSICRWVMQLHHGDIRVVTTGPSGTTFEATFPRRARGGTT